MLIQVCDDPTPMHCSTGQGQMHSPLSSDALQNRITAGLCPYIYSCEHLLLIQVYLRRFAFHTGVHTAGLFEAFVFMEM